MEDGAEGTCCLLAAIKEGQGEDALSSQLHVAIAIVSAAVDFVSVFVFVFVAIQGGFDEHYVDQDHIQQDADYADAQPVEKSPCVMYGTRIIKRRKESR